MASKTRMFAFLALAFAAVAAGQAPLEVGEAFVESHARVEMVPVPPGTFLMGNRKGEADERNVTLVTITRGFWFSKTEVTQAQWRRIMVRIPAHFTVDFEQPVEQVSWEDVVEYCQLLTEQGQADGLLPPGYVFRLPTEAEWEYACRATTTGDYAGKVKKMAWFDENSGNSTHPVARKQPNAWGLYDMHGNVWEWCIDWYAPSYAGGAVSDPVGPRAGEMRTRRGGSWWEPVEFGASSFRGRSRAEEQSFNIGFRIVLGPKLPQ
jgi:formylglycine-generating enzyme required for sulfatase activity